VPRDPGNAERVFTDYWAMVDHVTTSTDEGKYLYGFNSPVEAGNMVTQIMRKKYEPEDKTTKFDINYLAYQMVVFHDNNNNMEDAKNSVEVITSGIDGYFSRAIAFMKTSVETFAKRGWVAPEIS
jgi:hypothetical protein